MVRSVDTTHEVKIIFQCLAFPHADRVRRSKRRRRRWSTPYRLLIYPNDHLYSPWISILFPRHFSDLFTGIPHLWTMDDPDIPSSILIIGSGVFGLSTAHSLSLDHRFSTSTITVLDRSPFPSPDGSSIDSSRIVRADYADISYARLCLDAQARWREGWWGEGEAYHEDGLVIAIKNAVDQGAGDAAEEHRHGVPNLTGGEYMRRSLENVKRIGLEEGKDVEVLKDMAAVSTQFGQPDATKGDGVCMTFDADVGYINRRSGWVDARAAMENIRRKTEETGRVKFITGQARRLIFTPDGEGGHHVSGAELVDDTSITADLTILAAGAWTPSLLDMRGIASATGQVLGYIPLSPSESSILERNPTILNESTGLFIITPSASVLKVARHGYGYANPTTIPNPEPPSSSSADQSITVSLPRTCWDDPSHCVPPEGEAAMRAFLSRTFPSLASRPFTNTRLCWYTDTPHGDWIVSHHPSYKGLFVATGGSGHAFKFAPVVGDCVVQRILGEEVKYGLGGKWDWPVERMEGEGGQVWTEDWRGGRKGMVLDEEYKRGK